MADEDDRPYTTYKARPRFLQGRDDDGLDPRADDRPEYQVHGRRRRLDPRGWLPGRRDGAGPRRRLSVGRILRFVAFAAVAWVLLSVIDSGRSHPCGSFGKRGSESQSGSEKCCSVTSGRMPAAFSAAKSLS